MAVIEYKLQITSEGNIVPPFVKSGGNWLNPADFSMVGWLDPEPRKYWVPDTIVELSEEEFIQRLVAMHRVTPFTDTSSHDDHTEVDNMEEPDVVTMASAWYKNFVSSNS